MARPSDQALSPAATEPVVSAHSGDGPSRVPEGVCGDYRIEHFTVTEEDSRLTALRFWRDEYVPAGNYTRLMRGRTVVMSDTAMEKRTNYWIMRYATGDVLINGLGIGMVLRAVLAKPHVKSVRVIERSPEVIALVGPTFSSDPRLTIIEADALAYKPEKGERFDVAWHDIWDFICADNLPEMHKLHRRYGRYAKAQASWCREECEYGR